MATFTWIGGGGNLFTDTTDWDPNGTPAAGDAVLMPNPATTLIIDTGTVSDSVVSVSGGGDTIDLAGVTVTGITLTAAAGFDLGVTDSSIADSSLQVGDKTTIGLTSDVAAQHTIATVFLGKSGGGAESQLTETGAGDTVTLNAAGTIESDGLIFADSTGGSFIINPNSGTSGSMLLPGYFVFDGGLIAEPGDPVSISRATDAMFANLGGLVVAGGSLALNAQLDATSGEISIASGGAGIDTAVPFPQRLLFDDAAGTLTLAAGMVGGFAAAIGGFQPGDAIKLAGLNPAGISFRYGNGVLTLDQGGTLLGALTFQAAGFANATDFVIASDGSGGAVLTTTASSADWNGVTNGATTDWSAANWSDGTGAGGLPGTLQTAVIANNIAELAAFKDYVLTVSTAETAGSVVLDDHFSDLVLTAALTLQQGAGQSAGGELLDTAGSIEIDSGGELVTRQLDDLGNLTVDTGGTLAVSGVAPAVVQSGFAGIDIEKNVFVDGGTITGGFISVLGTLEPAQGGFIIGQNSGGNVSEQGGNVTASCTQLGGQPQGTGQLDISGAGTTWQDVGDAANTADAGIYRGDMVVGGGGFDPDGTRPPGGLGELTIDVQATVTEAGAAMLGVTGSDPSLPNTAPTSFGSAVVQNGATWKIGTFLNVGGSYLYSGTLPGGGTAFGGGGSVQVMFGGLVQLGTTETAGQYKVTLGTTPGSSGQVIVSGDAAVAGPAANGTSSLDTGGGAIAIGEAAGASGSLDVSSGGTVTAGAATPGIAWGAVIGDAGASGTFGPADGDLTVGSGGGASLFSDAGGLVDGNAGQGLVFVDTGGSLAVADTLAIGAAAGSNGTFTIGDGGTATAGAASLGLAIGVDGASGTLAAATGTLTVGTGGGGAMLGVTGDLADGDGGQGAAFVNAGATVTVSGTLFVGGVGTAGAGGDMDVTGGSLAAAAAVMWQGSTLSVGGAGVLAIGGAGTVAGIDVAAGATLAGAGLVVGNLDDGGAVVAAVAGHALDLTSDTITGTGTLAMLAGATLTLLTPVDFSNPIAFTGTAEVFASEVPTAVQGAITGFGIGDSIDLPGAVFPPAQTLSYDGVAGVLQFGTDAFHVGAGYHLYNFATQKEPAGSGTEIVFVPCFAAGTRILTAAGEIVVEALTAGSRVPTLSGALRRVRWIGRTRVDPGRQPRGAAPIRVAAHAFGAGMPHRDLLLSPDHAVWLDPALAPIHRLLNGATIRREPGAGAVEYFHVELDRHDVLFAEGLPAESFLDTGNRRLLADAAALST